MFHVRRFFGSACKRCNTIYIARHSPLLWQPGTASEVGTHAKPDMALVDLVTKKEVMLVEGKVRNGPWSPMCRALYVPC